jgi:RNA polymerase sigma-70 factor, ECF subfamily
VPTEANGQPAFALYMIEDDGAWHAFQLQVVTLTEAGISHMTVFFDLSLFTTFGLPLTLPADDQVVLSSVTP